MFIALVKVQRLRKNPKAGGYAPTIKTVTHRGKISSVASKKSEVKKMKIVNTIKQKTEILLGALGLCSSEIYYVNGSETLPPPLNRTEEEETFAALMNNSEKAREKLIVHNLRLVVYIAKKFESTGLGIEDLVSIGTIGLIKAVNTFRPDKNIKLATYASRCIENEILMFLRKSSQYRNEISIDEPLNVDWDGNELLLSDILGTSEDVVNKGIENEAERNMLMDAINALCPREREIMEMRFGLKDGKEKTQKEVADLIGISQSYISRLEKKIIKKLRKELEKI
jgi:RNA polymerase sporulation-specific sigma factor